jgi:hypothetical protein
MNPLVNAAGAVDAACLSAILAPLLKSDIDEAVSI